MSPRSAQTKALLARAKSYAADSLADGTTLLDDPLVATRDRRSSRTTCSPSELTAAPRRRQLRGGQAAPGVIGAEAASGTELQQAVTELVVDLAGPQSVASGRRRRLRRSRSGLEVATPTYLNLRKASIYGGSNEVQRTIIASIDPGTE
ncbi:MAG: acyl-CoA dehydrogenase family protein [Nocardioidaceae bacterium]